MKPTYRIAFFFHGPRGFSCQIGKPIPHGNTRTVAAFYDRGTVYSFLAHKADAIATVFYDDREAMMEVVQKLYSLEKTRPLAEVLMGKIPMDP